MKLHEKTLSSELLYEGIIVSLRKDTVELENGKTAYRELINHPGGVCVVALTPEEEVYMVKQFRYPFHTTLLELPAGKLSYGEDPLDCGKRELEEEIGIVAEEYVDLGKFYPTVGYVNEVISMYLATGLTHTHQHLDEDEFLDVEKYPLEQLYQMVMAGEIRDGKTQTAILKAYCLLHGKKNKA